MNALMRNCQSCGSIQRACIACPICGHDTGPAPLAAASLMAKAMEYVRAATWLSTNKLVTLRGDDHLGRALARREAFLAARDPRRFCTTMLAHDFLHEELALINAGLPGA